MKTFNEVVNEQLSVDSVEESTVNNPSPSIMKKISRDLKGSQSSSEE